MNKNKTLIIGASTDPQRYAYKAAERLIAHGHGIYLLGRREETLFGLPIETEKKPYTDVDTVTMYVSPKNQAKYADYIISLAPRRVIFNPGTENPELEALLNTHGIKTEHACTLVLLSTSQF